MSYQQTSLQQVINCFDDLAPLGATEISRRIQKDRTLVHRYIRELVSRGTLKKIGSGPHTKYVLVDAENLKKRLSNHGDNTILSYSKRSMLDQIFLKFSPDGSRLQGSSGFITWCRLRGLDPEKKADDYVDIHTYLESIRDTCGLLSAGKSFSGHVEKMHMNEVYYIDQYRWMDFGRGKLAELIFFAKQSQNTKLIQESMGLIIPSLQCFLKHTPIDAIAIVPWSIRRQHQLLGFFRTHLQDMDIPFISLSKYAPHGISVPQKSLRSREERIRNARETILVDEGTGSIGNYKNVLLIDDFVGSGSTLNEVAAKLKKSGVKIVIGLAFVGNLDFTYDVINEV